MSEEVLIVEDEVEVYDAFADLTQRHRGVQCPNCKHCIFSEDKGPSVSCRCGMTWVSGGKLYLKCGTSAPYNLCDIHIVSKRVQELTLAERVNPEPGSWIPQITDKSTPVLVDEEATILEDKKDVPTTADQGPESVEADDDFLNMY